MIYSFNPIAWATHYRPELSMRSGSASDTAWIALEVLGNNVRAGLDYVVDKIWDMDETDEGEASYFSRIRGVISTLGRWIEDEKTDVTGFYANEIEDLKFFFHLLLQRGLNLNWCQRKFTDLNKMEKIAFSICEDIKDFTQVHKVETLLLKADVLNKKLANGTPTESHERLEPEELRMLLWIKGPSKLIHALGELGVNVEPVRKRIKSCLDICQTPLFQQLQAMTENRVKPGQIFIDDRIWLERLSKAKMSCVYLAYHFYMGRYGHMGFFTERDEKICLSHMYRITQSHAVTRLFHPMLSLFKYTLEVDITSLVPSEEQRNKQRLQGFFEKKLAQLISEDRPEIKSKAERQNILGPFKGHVTGTDALQNWQNTNKEMNCAMYVAWMILTAVQQTSAEFKVNLRHPFGECENMENMDTLRLLYLLKEKNVLRVINPPELLGQLVNLPPALPI